MLLRMNLKKESMLKHVIATEAIMKGVAKFLGENEEIWGLVGLLHDIDFDETETNPAMHGILASEILKDKVGTDIIRAIRAHNFQYTHIEPVTRMEKALIASDSISGLLVACALVMPSKKLREVSTKTVAEKFKDKSFARGCDRNRLLFCEDIGIPKEKFFEIALVALQGISDQIGL